MRTLVLSAVAACLLASPALAQSGPPDAAPLPHRQGLSMEMPSFSEDGALQAAVAATTRPEADRARLVEGGQKYIDDWIARQAK